MTYDVDALRREEFPWAVEGETIFLNHASTGPLPARTVRVLEEWGWLRANPHRIAHELQFGTLDRSRELIARLVGASADEIALAERCQETILIQPKGVAAPSEAAQADVRN